MTITVPSLNHRFIYGLTFNPFERVWRMQAERTCAGCTGYDIVWDRLQKRMCGYCLVFDVWQPTRKPNGVCVYNARVRRQTKGGGDEEQTDRPQ
jgi:hypothetical protein